MLDTVILLLFCVLVGLVSLGAVVWVVASGQLFQLDGLMLTAICLTLGVIFLGNFAWSVRNGEFQRALNHLFKKPEKGEPSNESKAA
jgi:nitrogen fixation-related uncharacterized protein